MLVRIPSEVQVTKMNSVHYMTYRGNESADLGIRQQSLMCGGSDSSTGGLRLLRPALRRALMLLASRSAAGIDREMHAGEPTARGHRSLSAVVWWLAGQTRR